jgi:hypothetical protein
MTTGGKGAIAPQIARPRKPEFKIRIVGQLLTRLTTG